MAIYLISEEYLKENSPISQAIEYKMLKQHIITSQDIFIQELLGTKLYNQILEKYSAQTLTANEVLLVNIIKKVLVLRTFEVAIPFLAFQTTMAGVVQKSGEHYQPAGKSMIEYLVNETRDKAELYSKQVQEFLREHQPEFALWTGNNMYGVPATNQNYDSDLFIDSPFSFKRYS